MGEGGREGGRIGMGGDDGDGDGGSDGERCRPWLGAGVGTARKAGDATEAERGSGGVGIAGRADGGASGHPATPGPARGRCIN